MKYYFSANHVNNDAGGYRYLVTRAFCGTELISRSKVAGSAEEAKWHMQSFVQYYAMNEKQRKQQAAITASLFDGSMLSNHSSFRQNKSLTVQCLKAALWQIKEGCIVEYTAHSHCSEYLRHCLHQPSPSIAIHVCVWHQIGQLCPAP
jgi:hypothetical protein